LRHPKPVFGVLRTTEEKGERIMAKAGKAIDLQSLGIRQSSPKYRMMLLVSEGKHTAQDIQKRMDFMHLRPVVRLQKDFADIIKSDEKTQVLSLKGTIAKPEEKSRKAIKKAADKAKSKTKGKKVEKK
jgi:hypothetical protein